MTRSLSEEEERLTPTPYPLGRMLLFPSQGHKEEKGRWRKDYQTSSWRFLVEENVGQEDEEGNALEEENENKQVSELGTENENWQLKRGETAITRAWQTVVLVELTKQVPGSVSTVRNPDQPYFVELSSPTTTPTPTPTTWDNMWTPVPG